MTHSCKESDMVNNYGFIIHKKDHKNGNRHGYDVYKKNNPTTQKEVINVFDLGYLESNPISQNNCHLYSTRRRETISYPKQKKNITKSIL